MSMNNIEKQIRRLEAELEGFDSAGPAFLVSDSKGRGLSHCLERHDFINIIWKSGAQAGDAGLLAKVTRGIKDLENPIVMLWLGTCNFTRKARHGVLHLRGVTTDEVLHELESMKEDILKCNPSSEVIFLHCPVYSMDLWNANKGHESCDDKVLEDMLSSFNEAVDTVNRSYTPKFSLDLQRCTKKKGKSRYKYSYTSLYDDGIHPCHDLSCLWLLKVKKLVMDLQQQ